MKTECVIVFPDGLSRVCFTLMTGFKKHFFVLTLFLAGAFRAAAFTTNDANTIFTAYNSAYLIGGYYNGWWTGAEEIEMSEDAYVNSPTPARLLIVSNACNQFVAHHGSIWTAAGGNFNNYNDDISWAVIAFARGYQITGNTTFRDIAKNNWDGMYARAWDTNYFGGGLWWNTANQYKNAAVEGPATIGACLLYNIYGDTNYLAKAQAIYAWEKRVLLNSGNGSIADGITYTNASTSGGPTTYNQGTFIGAANYLYRATGLPMYYQDAVLVGKYTQNSMTSSGILPQYGLGDIAGFNGIFARWMARFAKDQNIWPTFGPWLGTNANAAWSVRNSTNLAWQEWATPMGTNAPNDWGCAASVVVMQVADPSPLDTLQISPAAGFTAVAQFAMPPNPISSNLVLTNTGGTSLDWTLVNTSAWLSVSASSGTLPAASPATNVLVSLIPSAVTNLPPGRYYNSVTLSNSTSGFVQSVQFLVVISAANAPIAMTGYNARMMAANTATGAAPGATAFDIPNNYCFYQAGLYGGTRGLPPDGTFTSLLDGATVFQFMPYGTSNALVLNDTYPASGTLTLATPQAYSSLVILASSANGGGMGTLVLNYTNGTHSSSYGFNAQDWYGTTLNVGMQGFGRMKLGGISLTFDDGGGAVNPNMYQTTLNLAALGITQPIASITFTRPTGAAGNQTVGIFAVSGALPYQSPIITQQPAPTNLFRFTGSNVTWSVAADAGPPVNYYWCQSGTNIPGATSTSLTLGNVQTGNSGAYTVIVSNAFGAVTSSVVTLMVAPAPAYPYGQRVVADGAIGYWRLDETSGTVAHDYVGGNNGIYTSKVLLGQPGDKLLDTHLVPRFGSLATSNSCVTNIPVDFATIGNAQFSVEAWVNGGAQTTDAGLVAKGFGNGGEQFNLDCGGGGHAFRFFVRDSSGNVHAATSGTTPNSQWHHLVGVCDEANSKVILYVDGVNVAQGAITTNSGLLGSSIPMSIGARQSGFGTAYDSQFLGYMEEVAVYGTALSASQVQAHYLAVTNRAPVFVSNPFTAAGANAGQAYSDTLAAYASDPNGDTVTFSKSSGPAWLSVAGNGALSGTPFSGDVGTNSFVVRAADPSGLFNTATMNVVVATAPPIVLSSMMQGTNFQLNWTGGIAPFQVQFATDLVSSNWQNLGAPIGANTLAVAPTNDASFFRVFGQ